MNTMADKSNTVGGRGYRVWTTSEEKSLIEGVTAMGVGNWEAIRMNKKFSLSQRSALQLKDKWRNLVKYKHVSTDDFPADVAVSNRRRSTSTMAALHKITGKRSPSSSPLSTPPHTPKKSKLSCPASPASSVSSYQHADFGPNGLHRVESVTSLPGKAKMGADISDLDRALHMVHRGKNMMETAVQIQNEANQLLTAALGELALCSSDPATIKRVESAHRIASMSNAKAERCKGFLESAMKQLQDVQRPFSNHSTSSTNERQNATGIEGTDDSQPCSAAFEKDCSYFMSQQVSQTIELNEDEDAYGLPAMDYFNLLGDLGNELYDELV